MNETNLTEAKSLIAEMLRDGAELKAVTGGSFTDAMADWLGPQYLLAARDALSGVPSGQRWEILRAMVQDWAGLRRGDHWAARLQLEREALDWKRANGQAQKEAEFREWGQAAGNSEGTFSGADGRDQCGDYGAD